jgi:hypothetical protein
MVAHFAAAQITYVHKIKMYVSFVCRGKNCIEMNPPITVYGPQDDCLILRKKTAPENLSLYGSRFIKSLSQLWF